MALDFGALKKKPKVEAPSKPERQRVPHKDWKKEHRSLRKEYDNLSLALTEVNTEYTELEEKAIELKDENVMLREQEAMSKQALDKLTQEIENYKFRPGQYSEIARILICMRVRGNKSQKEQIKKIVGSTAIEDVRDHIFKLLEAPYQ